MSAMSENKIKVKFCSIYPEENNNLYHFFLNCVDYENIFGNDLNLSSVFLIYDLKSKLIVIRNSNISNQRNGDKNGKQLLNHNVNNCLTIYGTKRALKEYSLNVNKCYIAKPIFDVPLISSFTLLALNDKAEEWLKSLSFRQTLCKILESKYPLLIRKECYFLCPYNENFREFSSYCMDLLENVYVSDCFPIAQGLLSLNTKIIIQHNDKMLNNIKKKSTGVFTFSEPNLNTCALLVSDFTFGLSNNKSLDTGIVDNAIIQKTASIIDSEEWDNLTSSDTLFDYRSTLLISETTARLIGLFDNSFITISVKKCKTRIVLVKFISTNSNNIFISNVLAFNMLSATDRIFWLIEKELTLFIQKSIIEEHLDSCSNSLTLKIPYAETVYLDVIFSPNYNSSVLFTSILTKYFSETKLISEGDILAIPTKNDEKQFSYYDDISPPEFIYFFVKKIICNIKFITYNVDNYNTTLYQHGTCQSFIPPNFDSSNFCLPSFNKDLFSCLNYCMPFIDKKHSVLLPGILITGSNGCGKTSLAKTIANHLGFHYLTIHCQNLTGDTAGATESKIKQMFNKIDKISPIILILQNIDLLAREKVGNDDNIRISASFKQMFIKLNSNTSTYPYIIIGTSKDESMNPDGHKRKEILKELLKSSNLSTDLSLEYLAQRTAGFVLSDLLALIIKTKEISKKISINTCYYQSNEDVNENNLLDKLQLLEQCGLILTKNNFDISLNILQSEHSDSIGAPKIPQVSWNDIGGLENIKDEILNTIQLPLQQPNLFKTGLRRSGLLLYGPPGSGKTLLAKAVATECSLNFLSVKGPELINMYVGQSEENIREVFLRAQSASPCIIFFDELDSLAPNRGRSGDSGGVMDRIVSQLLTELDGLHESFDVFVIGATNRPDLLDSALLRPGRFDKLLFLGVADKKQKLLILKALTNKMKLDKNLSLDHISHSFPNNVTGADLSSICSEAALNAVKRTIDEGNVDCDNVYVSEEDFINALDEFIPSVSIEELHKYELIRKSINSNEIVL